MDPVTIVLAAAVAVPSGALAAVGFAVCAVGGAAYVVAWPFIKLFGG